MKNIVEKHKRGWAAIEVFDGLTKGRTVVGIYKTKGEAEKHWNKLKLDRKQKGK